MFALSLGQTLVLHGHAASRLAQPTQVVTTGFVASIGLLADITGAFFLAESFVLKKRTKAVRDVRDYWNGNPYRLRSAIYQSIEARAGFFFLLLGFTGQFLGYTDLFPTGRNRFVLLSLLGGVCISVGALLLVHRWTRYRSRREVAREWADPIKKDSENISLESCELYGGALDLNRGQGESVQQFRERIVRLSQEWKPER
jgi:hypothetical protein